MMLVCQLPKSLVPHLAWGSGISSLHIPWIFSVSPYRCEFYKLKDSYYDKLAFVATSISYGSSLQVWVFRFTSHGCLSSAAWTSICFHSIIPILWHFRFYNMSATVLLVNLSMIIWHTSRYFDFKDLVFGMTGEH